MPTQVDREDPHGKSAGYYGRIDPHEQTDDVREVSFEPLDQDRPEPLDRVRAASMDAYREAHPTYSRIILRMLVRVNGLEGDPEQAVVRELPMLGLRRAGT